MTNVTFGEKVAAGVVGGTILGAVVLTALGTAMPAEIFALLPAALGYVLGSRTSQPSVIK